MTLDPTISVGQGGHITDHEELAIQINMLEAAFSASDRLAVGSGAGIFAGLSAGAAGQVLTAGPVRWADPVGSVRDAAAAPYLVGPSRTASQNVTGLTSALADAATAGGGTVSVPAHTTGTHLDIDARIVVPNKVGLIGAGSAQGGGATDFRCTTAGAGISIGSSTAGSSGPPCGGFSIDGNHVSTNPFYVGGRVGSTIASIDVRNGVSVNWFMQATQNCFFYEVNLQTADLDGFRIQDGAATNTFLKCEFGQSAHWNMHFFAVADLGSGAAYPLNNLFLNCIVEYDSVTSLAMIAYQAGQNNMFSDCIIVAPQYAKTLIDMTNPTAFGPPILRLRDNTLQFNFVDATTAGVKLADACGVLASGLNVINGAYSGIKLIGAAPTGAWEETGYTLFNGVTVPEDAAAGYAAANITAKHRATGLTFKPNGTDTVEQTYVDGDAYPRWRRDANGAQNWGDGTSFPGDTLYRSGAGALTAIGNLGATGKIIGTTGLAVGNSAAASTPGTVVKKMEVFNSAGTSLGFVPIYDAIT